MAGRGRQLLALILAANGAHAAPFNTVDQNPLLAGFHVPTAVPARVSSEQATVFGATLNWSNTAAIENRGDESLVLDAERRDWQLTLAHAVSSKFAVRAQLPYRTVSGGMLDGFIEEWHETFGMPNGNRPQLPQDELGIQYRRNAADVYARTGNYSGLGDLTLGIGYQLRDAPSAATSIWWHIKLPTGSSDVLASSGAFDASLNIAHERALSSRWTVHAQLNAIRLGSGDFERDRQRSWMWSGMTAFDYRYSQNVSLTLQVDGHTAAFNDTAIEMFGPAWTLTVGGEYRWRSGWRAQVGVGEDVKVDASPDVVFTLTLEKALGVSR